MWKKKWLGIRINEDAYVVVNSLISGLERKIWRLRQRRETSGQTVGCGHATPRLLASMLMPMKEHPPKTIGLAKLTQPVVSSCLHHWLPQCWPNWHRSRVDVVGRTEATHGPRSVGARSPTLIWLLLLMSSLPAMETNSESFLCHYLLKRLTSHLARSNNEVFFIEKLA